MAVTVKLGGYEYAEGGVRHDIQVNGEDTIDREEEFVVHLEVTPGRVVRAVMEYAGGRWQCRLTAPDDTKVFVDQQPAQGAARAQQLLGRVAYRNRMGDKLQLGVHLGEGFLPLGVESTQYHLVDTLIDDVGRNLQIGELVSFTAIPRNPASWEPPCAGYWTLLPAGQGQGSTESGGSLSLREQVIELVKSRGGVRLVEVSTLLRSTSNPSQVRNVLLDLVNEDILTFTLDRTIVIGVAQPKEA